MQKKVLDVSILSVFLKKPLVRKWGVKQRSAMKLRAERRAGTRVKERVKGKGFVTEELMQRTLCAGGTKGILFNCGVYGKMLKRHYGN